MAEHRILARASDQGHAIDRSGKDGAVREAAVDGQRQLLVGTTGVVQ